jgi:two-component system CheB/CheR fusion protein
MEEQLRRQAAQLLEQDRNKNEFLALLGHELRNPLSSLRSAIDTLKLQASPNQTANQELLALSDRQLRQLTHLINDLQDVARISQGKITLQKRRVALANIVSHAVETIMPLVNHNQQQLAVSLPEQALYLEAEPERLVQVLTNLLHNAVKYTDRGGQLWLRVKQNDNIVEIQLQDTGRGISPELLPKIFELFFQSRHGAAGGLGLGLTLVQRLVELHGGDIRAFSPGPEQGSTFTIRLPLADSGPETSAAQPPSAAAQSGHRILIVEDDPAVARSLTLMLKRLGHAVETVYSGEAALQALQTFQPDVVLSDIGLPDISGYEVARQVRNRYPRQAPLLIALTGYFREADVQQAGDTGFDHYLLKPLDLEALNRLLETGETS